MAPVECLRLGAGQMVYSDLRVDVGIGASPHRHLPQTDFCPRPSPRRLYFIVASPTICYHQYSPPPASL